MVIAATERLYSYIQDETERLKAAKKAAAAKVIVVWIVALGLWSSGQIGAGHLVLLMAGASAWASIQEAIRKLHFINLATLHRDLDRDSATGLEGFETLR